MSQSRTVSPKLGSISANKAGNLDAQSNNTTCLFYSTMAALAVSPLKNIREEISSSGTNTPRKPPSPTTDATESTLNQPHSSNVTPRRQRGASVSSRVSVDHFDPAGVNQLRRTMSRQNEFSKPGKSQTSQSSGDVPEDSFDFEKALGDYILR